MFSINAFKPKADSMVTIIMYRQALETSMLSKFLGS